MKKTSMKNSADFDYIERTTWQYCKARGLATDRQGLAFRLATEPTDLMDDIASFGVVKGDKLANSIVKMIARIAQ